MEKESLWVRVIKSVFGNEGGLEDDSQGVGGKGNSV